MHVTLGMTAGTESLELPPPDAWIVNQGFRQDGPCRVARTQKQHVEHVQTILGRGGNVHVTTTIQTLCRPDSRSLLPRFVDLDGGALSAAMRDGDIQTALLLHEQTGARA